MDSELGKGKHYLSTHVSFSVTYSFQNALYITQALEKRMSLSLHSNYQTGEKTLQENSFEYNTLNEDSSLDDFSLDDFSLDDFSLDDNYMDIVPQEIRKLLCKAYKVCLDLDRFDIICTYVCNLVKTHKDVNQIISELTDIIELNQRSASYSFVVIHY